MATAEERSELAGEIAQKLGNLTAVQGKYFIDNSEESLAKFQNEQTEFIIWVVDKIAPLDN